MLAAHAHLDAPERVTSDVVGIVVERDAFGRDEEILRYTDVFREKTLRFQLFVAPDPVLFVYIFADQPVDVYKRQDMLRSSILRLREVSCFLSSSKSSIIVFVSINNRYCRLKSVLFSLFAQSFLKAPFFVRIVDRLQKIFEQVTERCDRIAYRTAFVCGECLSAVQAQRMVDFGETELPVDFRTVEPVSYTHLCRIHL